MTSGFRLPSEYTTFWSGLWVGVSLEVFVEIMKACHLWSSSYFLSIYDAETPAMLVQVLLEAYSGTWIAAFAEIAKA